MAIKIENQMTYCMLPPEFHSEPAAPYNLPDDQFRRCLVLSQSSHALFHNGR